MIGTLLVEGTSFFLTVRQSLEVVGVPAGRSTVQVIRLTLSPRGTMEAGRALQYVEKETSFFSWR